MGFVFNGGRSVKNKALLGPFLIVFLSLLVFTAGIVFPIAAPLAVFTAPAFLMTLERRNGARVALLGVCFGTAVLLVAANGILSFTYLTTVGLLGVFFGHMAGRAKSGAEFMLASVTASVLVKVFLMAFFYVASGENLFYISPERAEQMAAGMAEFFSLSGLAAGDEAVRLYAKAIVDTVSMQMPSILILFSVCDTFISYFISWKIIKRFGGGKIISLPPFGLWKFPRNVFLAFFVAIIADAIGRTSPSNQAFTMIAANILELLRWLLLLEGLALCWYYMTARGVGRPFKVAATVICAVWWPVSFIMYSLGFVDIWFDLRRHIRRKQK